MAASTSKAAKHAMAAASSATPEVKIPIIRTKENAKKLPTYHSALQRSKESSIAAEDLDSLQLELESLLSNTAVRYRVLKSEYESLDKDERRNEKRSKHAAASGEKPPASPATTSTAEGKMSAGNGKRKRDDTSGVRKPKHTLASSIKHTKHSKNSPLGLNTDDSDYGPTGSQSHHHMQKLSLPKNDIPNKFWLSVEPYCMPLTNEDLRMLDDLLDQYKGPLVPQIPDLGPHYSTTWATEDVKDIQQASNPSSHSNRLKPQNSGPNNMLKKADAMVDDSITGPLTQRLVSALLEEQLVSNPSDLIGPDSSNSSSENTHSSSHLNFRSLSLMRSGAGIEKRVKKELIEQGILDISDFPNNDEDEILSEIKRVTTELSAVAEYNSTTLKRLRDSAAEEIKLLEIKRKLDAIDQEILETYKRCMHNKAKRKPITAEEQHEIFRLTAEQTALSNQLERSQANSAISE